MQTFTVLSDPTRARIIDTLAKRPHSAGELVALSDLTQPAISRHLRILREAGFVTSTPDGQKRIYALRPEPFIELHDWLDGFRRFWADKLDDLDSFLDEGASHDD